MKTPFFHISLSFCQFWFDLSFFPHILPEHFLMQFIFLLFTGHKKILTHRNYETIRTHDDTGSKSLRYWSLSAHIRDRDRDPGYWCHYRHGRSSRRATTRIPHPRFYYWILPPLHTWSWGWRLDSYYEHIQHQNQHLAVYVLSDRWIIVQELRTQNLEFRKLVKYSKFPKI